MASSSLGQGQGGERALILVLQVKGPRLIDKRLLSEVTHKDMSEAGLGPGALRPKLSPVLTLDPRCCEDGGGQDAEQACLGLGKGSQVSGHHQYSSRVCGGSCQSSVTGCGMKVWGPESLSNIPQATVPLLPSWNTTNVS